MGKPCKSSIYIIAEAGVNHNGDLDRAMALIDVAAASGADAVKFQTFSARRLASSTAPKAAYQQRTTDVHQSQLEMLRALELPPEWHEPLQQHARQKGIQFLSTAFDRESLAFLETINLPLYKIPSGELTNGPLLWDFARTGKPLVVSTGMASLSDVEQALAVLCHGMHEAEEPDSLHAVWRCWSDGMARTRLQERVSLLHCTSQYPTPLNEVNLLAMDTLSKAFHLPVGYSDHTQGNLVALAAVARGARIIEKHFTLDRSLPGPDHKASLEPDELTALVRDIRSLELAFGDGYKGPQPSEWDTRRAARQSLVTAQDVREGEVFTGQNLTTGRAGGGLSAMHYWDQIGQKAQRDYKAGETL